MSKSAVVEELQQAISYSSTFDRLQNTNQGQHDRDPSCPHCGPRSHPSRAGRRVTGGHQVIAGARMPDLDHYRPTPMVIIVPPPAEAYPCERGDLARGPLCLAQRWLRTSDP